MNADDITPGGITWGGQVGWGGDVVLGGDAPAFVPDTAICHLLVTAEYPSDPTIRVWTGIGELELNGDIYMGVGPEAVSIQVGQATDKEDARLQVTLMGFDEPDTRRAFYEFKGRVRVTVQLAYSVDGGVSWQVVPRQFRGLYSRPRITSGLVSFEVATYREELDRGYEQLWSDANQQIETPGDLFFNHIKRIAEGAALTMRWPP